MVRMIYMQDYEPPSGDVSAALEKQFGSVDQFIEKFNGAAAGIQVQSDLPYAARCLRISLCQRKGGRGGLG